MTAPTGKPKPEPPSETSSTPGDAAGDVAAIEGARAALGDALLEAVVFRGETTLVVAKERVLDALASLRDDPALGYDRLADLTAVDYLDLGRGPRFAVVYHLMSRQTYRRLRLRAPVPEDEPFIASAVGLYPAANFLEREVYDMFGIGFVGHPNLTRILMPEDWVGHPLRKDFPLGAEEVTFSFNQGAKDEERQVPIEVGEARYGVSVDTLFRGGYEPGDAAGRERED
ncbi:MAG TPA: NADH-quinone oxidoreductase subunit C [Thermomicrobiales bacterium]|nr:NADH-quinone oxidoreductase subunit C [Thermomicrobiales bacterium]